MRQIDAHCRDARALRFSRSQSLARRRQRLSQAMVRSTIQRFGSTTNFPAATSERLTIEGGSHGRADLIQGAGWIEVDMDRQTVIDEPAVVSIGWRQTAEGRSMGVFQVEQLDDDAAKAAQRPIVTAIDAFNDEASDISNPSRLLAVTIPDPESGEITGGLYRVSYYGWLFIELLVIPERYRGQRLGTRLIQQAEAAASDRGCVGV